jgi:DNA repair protein RecO (recombination protein O)
LKLIAREDPHPALFDEYATALRALAEGVTAAAQAAVLRGFEVRLLAELGYALPLTHDVESGAAIDAADRYHYVFDRGPHRATAHVAREPGTRWPTVRGATLLALATRTFPDAEVAAEAKRLMREVLDHYLEARHIFSRRVVRDLQALEEEGPAS